MKKTLYSNFKIFGLLLGPLLLILILITPPPEGISIEGWKVIGCTLLMVSWWVSGAVPIGITSLLPLALFPILGLFTIKESAAPFASSQVYLFLGGFLIASAVEKWHLHTRIALSILKIIGTNANGIIAGFMIAGFLLSLWMSNTATTVMMLPIGISVIELFVKGHGANKKYKNFATALIIGIAYSANIGGIATLIGTPTNGVLTAFMQETFSYNISFLQWSLIAGPIAIILMIFTWLILIKVFPNKLGHIEGSDKIINTQLKELGRMNKGEKLVAIVFGLTALLWISRELINKFFPTSLVSDEAIAIAAAILLFIIPVNIRDGEFLLDWNTAKKIPWDILLLFGGGLSLAAALAKTGLVQYVGNQLGTIEGMTPMIFVALSSTILSIATTFMGNMTLAGIAIPMMTSVSLGFNINPLVVNIPITIAASLAFMLPISTPPNAVAYSSGYVKIIDLIKAGFLVNLIGIIILILMSYNLTEFSLGIDLKTIPDWIKNIQ